MNYKKSYTSLNPRNEQKQKFKKTFPPSNCYIAEMDFCSLRNIEFNTQTSYYYWFQETCGSSYELFYNSCLKILKKKIYCLCSLQAESGILRWQNIFLFSVNYLLRKLLL